MSPSLRSLIVFAFLIPTPPAHAQAASPVSWSFSSAAGSENESTIILRASIKRGWHLYSQHIAAGGPVPTTVTFTPSQHYYLNGPTSESGASHDYFDDIYQMKIRWYDNMVEFRQNIKVNPGGTTVTGKIEYMSCNGEICYPNEEVFTIDIQ